MRFAEIFARRTRPVISFEVFPPRTDAAWATFRTVLPELVALGPDFMTVTYGALGANRGRTLEIASMIRREHRMETACHLTCVGSGREEIGRIADDIARADIENIVALRGDPPQGEAAFVAPPGGFRHACELVRFLRGRGRFGIAVAGYPEKHLEAPDLESDLDRLKEKVDCGADVVITQLFYDNAHYFRFVEKARARGISVPIVPGLLPILSPKQVLKITSMCGSTIPAALRSRLEAAAEDEARALEVGVCQAVEQVAGLLGNGAPGIHFYVLNRSLHMAQIMEAVRPLLRVLESVSGPTPPGPASRT